MARSGRRPGESGARERIAESAREAFGELGFDGATMRSIATRAGVDPALVHHYFGTKQRLFLTVMSLPFDATTLQAQLVGPGRDGVGERLVRFFLGLWDEPAVRPILTGLVRSAMTGPDAAILLRDFLGRQGLFRLVAAIAPDQPDFRAVLVGSHLIGLAMARYIVGLEPLAS
ncbi:MAG TPA: TetR family transcriptional regulator, partial [Candidatus Limnocylindrales bacterium]|nr:TetR family transcriptional regulator [Candidatus Limnocylindrales bacterium]